MKTSKDCIEIHSVNVTARYGILRKDLVPARMTSVNSTKRLIYGFSKKPWSQVEWKLCIQSVLTDLRRNRGKEKLLGFLAHSTSFVVLVVILVQG